MQDSRRDRYPDRIVEEGGDQKGYQKRQEGEARKQKRGRQTG